MRVLMVSAAYPPDRCGVGDYARHLTERLDARKRVEVALLTAAPQAAASGLRIFRAEPSGVRSRDLYRAARQFAPQIVHVQVPTRRLISPLVALFARRALLRRVVQTWHELPAEWHWSGWLGIPALDRVVHVRPDLPSRLDARLRRLLRPDKLRFVPGGRTIPPAVLSEPERAALRQAVGGGRPVVAFFGFMHPNKGVEDLFDIADPERHHLLLIGELDESDPYQRRIAVLASGGRWRGHATVTGFLDAAEVARLLAAADAIVFPFPDGAGSWNTSLAAALASGSLVLATGAEPGRSGYDAKRNLLLVERGDRAALREGLARRLGARVAPDTSDPWDAIAQAHEAIYAELA